MKENNLAPIGAPVPADSWKSAPMKNYTITEERAQHMRKIMVISLTIVVATLNIRAFAAEMLIPRTMVDKGTYYLLDAKTRGSITTTLHKRVGVNETGYSKTEISCKTMQYRDMGYSEAGLDKIAGTPGKWTDVLSGSSKSDLLNFVCSHKS